MNTTSNPWDQLPNANHIDRFIASDNHHGDIWNSVLNIRTNIVMIVGDTFKKHFGIE